jgi:hypothetical protein
MGQTQEEVTPVVAQKTGWMKTVLHHVRPSRERAFALIKGKATPIPKPVVLARARKNVNDPKRTEFETEYDPLDKALTQSLLVTKPVRSIVTPVRVAEQAAQDARTQAEIAAAKGLWTTTPALLAKLKSEIGKLDLAYGTAADALDAKLEKRLAKLAYFKTALEKTGLDATDVTQAIADVTQARLNARAASANEKRLVALVSTVESANTAAVAAAKALKATKNTQIVAGLDAIRFYVENAISSVTDPVDKKRYEDLLNDWDQTRDTAIAETDPTAKTNALLACKGTLDRLLEDVSLAAGEDAEQWRQAAFKSVLENQYGIVVQPPTGHDNTNYEMFSEMLDLLPLEHTWHASLTKLQYEEAGDGAAFDPGTKAVIMGRIGKFDEEPYYDPISGNQVDQNWFKISTLHEVGHAVDDRYGIMTSPAMEADASGGWKYETVDSTVDALAAYIAGSLAVDEATLKGLIRTALQTGAYVQPPLAAQPPPTVPEPGKVSAADWTTLKPLLDECTTCVETASPWNTNGGAKTDKRCYHQAYATTWVSYSLSAKAGNKAVRPYQWRAPGEWFAEIYAYSWMMKQVPPGVAPTVLKFMYSPKR